MGGSESLTAVGKLEDRLESLFGCRSICFVECEKAHDCIEEMLGVVLFLSDPCHSLGEIDAVGGCIIDVLRGLH